MVRRQDLLDLGYLGRDGKYSLLVSRQTADFDHAAHTVSAESVLDFVHRAQLIRREEDQAGGVLRQVPVPKPAVDLLQRSPCKSGYRENNLFLFRCVRGEEDLSR